jgi:hypothetical protein
MQRYPFFAYIWKNKIHNIQEMVRFCVYFRIKPLCSTAGLPDGLFFWVSALRPYSPGKVMTLSLSMDTPIVDGADYWGL